VTAGGGVALRTKNSRCTKTRRGLDETTEPKRAALRIYLTTPEHETKQRVKTSKNAIRAHDKSKQPSRDVAIPAIYPAQGLSRGPFIIIIIIMHENYYRSI